MLTSPLPKSQPHSQCSPAGQFVSLISIGRRALCTKGIPEVISMSRTPFISWSVSGGQIPFVVQWPTVRSTFGRASGDTILNSGNLRSIWGHHTQFGAEMSKMSPEFPASPSMILPLHFHAQAPIPQKGGSVECTMSGEKRPKGGQERRVVGGEKAPKREPPQKTDNGGLETVPDARGQEGCGRWSIMR